MKTRIFVLSILVLCSACKKESFDTEDETVYKWERDLYRRALPPDPSNFQDDIWCATDYVYMTGSQAKLQSDSIKRASGRFFWYEYKKINKEL